MPKLSDTQLIVLSRAAAREDGVAVIPQGMKKAAAAKVGSSLVARKLMREIRSKAEKAVWREVDGKNFSLVITRAGRDAIGVEQDVTVVAPSTAKAAPPGMVAKRPKAGSAAQPEPQSNARSPRPGSKQALVVEMLSKGDGASLDALVEATGWLPHTTRAALTGLRKRGYAVDRVKDASNGSLYHIVEKPSAGIGA